ncbi:MAG: DUF6677 family protein [Pirellulaceae bacterium]
MPSDATMPPADDDSQEPASELLESEPVELEPVIRKTLQLDLRTPWIAAVCAWVFPGAGHFYQRRYMKGCIFMVCILAIYFAGLIMGGGHVVYASWVPEGKRWQYIFQVGVGLPAFPSIVQCRRARSEEFLEEVRFIREVREADFYPEDNTVTADELIELLRIKSSSLQLSPESLARYRPGEILARWDANSDGVLSMDELPAAELWPNGWMAPPIPINVAGDDQLAQWHHEYGALFDMGTLYTLVAGLLNVLAIFDAQAGPLILSREEDQEKKKSIQTRMKFNKG